MKKNILLVVLIILVLILIILCSLSLYKNSKNTTFSYLLLQTVTISEDLVDCKQILTFDENDICIDCRLLYEFKEEDLAQKQYEDWIEIPNNLSKMVNINKNATIITFNSTNYNGSHKSEFLNSSQNTYIEI